MESGSDTDLDCGGKAWYATRANGNFKFVLNKPRLVLGEL